DPLLFGRSHKRERPPGIEDVPERLGGTAVCGLRGVRIVHRNVAHIGENGPSAPMFGSSTDLDDAIPRRVKRGGGSVTIPRPRSALAVAGIELVANWHVLDAADEARS